MNISIFGLIIDLDSLFEFFFSPNFIILGWTFWKYDLSTVKVILWKLDNPVSATEEFWKLLGQLVINFGSIRFL